MGAFVDFLKSGGGSFTGSALGAAASFVSSAIGYNRQKSLLRRQQAYQTAEREASQKWQEKMWQAQNDYNSPGAVMARLKANGLNPDLYYSGSGVHGAASSVPGSTASGAPSVPNPAGQSGLDQAAQMLGQSVREAAEIRNINTNTRKLESDILVNDNVIKVGDSTVVLQGALAKESEEKRLAIAESVVDMFERRQQYILESNQALEKVKVDSDKIRLEIEQSKKSFDVQFEQLKSNLTQTQLQNKQLMQSIGFFNKMQPLLLQEKTALINKAKSEGRAIDLNNINIEAMQKAREKFALKHGKDASQDYYFETLCDLQVSQETNNLRMCEHKLKQSERYDDINACLGIVNTVVNTAGNVLRVCYGIPNLQADTKLKRQEYEQKEITGPYKDFWKD